MDATRPPGKTPQCGFSLLELLISICIIGIVIATAVPIYKSYVVQTRLTDSLVLMSHHRAHIASYFSITGAMPEKPFEYLRGDLSESDNSLGMPVNGDSYEQNTEELQSDEGALTASTTKLVETGERFKLSLQPALWEAEYSNPRVLLWLCGTETPPDGAIALGINRTNVPPKFLPSTCRN